MFHVYAPGDSMPDTYACIDRTDPCTGCATGDPLFASADDAAVYAAANGPRETITVSSPNRRPADTYQ